jgi:hypothetical protein
MGKQMHLNSHFYISVRMRESSQFEHPICKINSNLYVIIGDGGAH